MTRFCLRCNTRRDSDQFDFDSPQRNWCLPCQAQWRVAEQHRLEDPSEHPHAFRQRRTFLRQAYGLSPADVDTMLVAQSGRCAICGSVMRKYNIDHDLASGIVRGLLCSRCNLALGWYEAGGTEVMQAYLSDPPALRALGRAARAGGNDA